MDTLTHIAIGACIGEAMCGKKLGKRAMLLGAIAQSLPDIDFVAALWTTPAENLLAHRGFTHSLLFIALATPLLALASWQLHRPHNIPVRKWMLFYALQGLLHVFLDGFNAYGTGWLEPFSHRRFAFNVLYVADPLFSLGPAIALFALLVLHRRDKRRALWWLTGLLASCAYLLYAVSNKRYIDNTTREMLAQQHIRQEDFITTPTPFNNWLWYIVVKNPTGYYIGFRSVFDARNDAAFHFFPKNDSLLKPVSDHESLQHLIRFSRGYYTIEQWKDTLVFNDLRFGQIAGWDNPTGRFVFHYYLSHHADNTLVVQRGRFEGWDMQTVRSLLNRIRAANSSLPAGNKK